MKKKILVLGSGGMAGHIITLKLREHADVFQVTAVAHRDNALDPEILLDVTDRQALNNVLLENKPDVIVNCIGILNQAAEDRPDKAILINSYLPHFLAQFTRDSTARVIHISTDCVFSGSKGGYTETDPKDGKGFYAQTKALGEIVNQKDLTIRTSIIGPELNANGIGLFNWFAKQQGRINGYTGAYWTGVTTIELANAIIKAIGLDLTGLYQLVNNGKISKFSLLQLFLSAFSQSEVAQITPYENYRVDKSLVNTRTDHRLEVPSYDRMVKEMKQWIDAHKDLYPHYRHLQ
jgi:dTDP-4-dehydrorhamnose reductase